LALFAVGAALKLEALKEGIRIPAAGALIKVAVGPAAGFLIGKRFGLSAVELQIAMLFLACPTAVMSFVMAEQLGNDEELTARIIVASSLLALPSLAAILMLSRWF
jgi:predicted permease